MKQVSRIAGFLVTLTGLVIGTASAGLGAWTLAILSESYEPGDIIFDDGPELFQAWLIRQTSAGTPSAAAIGRRLLVMPISSRRSTIDAMMGPAFWDRLSIEEAERAGFLRLMESGVLAALAKAPSAGEFWLLASRIRTQHSGFDRKAETYLSASYLMAPREAGVARARLVFTTQISPLLRGSFEEEQARDLTSVKQTYPAFERVYRKWVDGQGARRIDGLRR